MKLRFSNGKDFAFTFEANDLPSFREQGLSALKSFRIATERRIHRGEIHKTVSWFDRPTLHLYDEEQEQWLNLGLKKSMNTISFGEIAFFEPRQVEMPGYEAFTIDEQFRQDEIWFLENSDAIWQMCIDTWEWGNALNLQIMKFGDDLHRYTENESE